MKKLITILFLVLSLSLSLISCGDEDYASDSSESQVSETQVG